MQDKIANQMERKLEMQGIEKKQNGMLIEQQNVFF